MNYTDKYLIKDISNAKFKKKYGVVAQKQGNMSRKRPYGYQMSHKEAWMQRILRKNPWLREPEPTFESLQSEDQAHLDSIRVEV